MTYDSVVITGAGWASVQVAAYRADLEVSDFGICGPRPAHLLSPTLER